MDQYATMECYIGLYEHDAEIARLTAELQKHYSSETGEIQRLESVLKRIAEWGCNGQCVELAGIKCPCCIAQEAIDAAKDK